MRALGSSDGTISSNNNNNFWSEGPTHLEVECEKSNKWEVPDTIKLNEAIHGKNATFSFRKISVKRNLLLREEWFRQTASTPLAQSRDGLQNSQQHFKASEVDRGPQGEGQWPRHLAGGHSLSFSERRQAEE